MKRIMIACCVFVSSLGSAFAGEQTVVLRVPGMFCAACPYVVAKSLKSVNGVVSVATSLKAKTARVIYEDTLTSPKALTNATKRAGYPSTIDTGAAE